MGFWRGLVAAQPTLEISDPKTVDLNDKSTEKRVIRKQDIHLLPWMCITYLLSKSSWSVRSRRE